MDRAANSFSQRAVATVLVVLFGGLAPAIAQQEPPSEPVATPETQALTFTDTVEVNVVSVYATVVDKKGNPVTGLTAADFIIEESGNPMEITNFLAVGTVETGMSGEVSAATATGVGTDGVDNPPEFLPSQVAVVFDNTGLEKRQRKRVLKALAPWVSNVTTDGGEVLVAVLEPELHILMPFTSDPSMVLSAFDEVAQRESMGDMTKSRKRVMVRDLQSTPSITHEAKLYEPPEITPGGGYNPGSSSSGGSPSTVTSTFGSAPQSDTQQALQYLNQIEMHRRQEYSRLGETLVGMDRMIRGLSGLPGRKDVLWVTEDLMIQPGVDLYNVYFSHFAGAAQELNLDQPEIWGTQLQLLREFQYIAGVSQIASTVLHVVDASDRDREAASADFKTPELSSFDNASQGGTGVTGGYDMSAVRSQAEGSSYLSAATGGLYFGGSRNYDGFLDRLTGLMGAYYSIGYRRPGSPDGRLHDVKVKVNREGLNVWTHERVPNPTLDQVLADMAVSRLLIDEGSNPLALKAVLGPSEPAEDDKQIQEVRIQIPAQNLTLVEEGPNQVGTVSVAVVAADVDGNALPPRLLQLTIKLPTERVNSETVAMARLRLMMEKETHDIAVAVRDQGSGTEASTMVVGGS